MTSTEQKFPSDLAGRLAGFFLLALIPAVTLIPVTPQPAWLTQDFILRWVSAFVFFLCLGRKLGHFKLSSPLVFDFPNMLFLLLAGWVLLSVINSQEAFDSFYAYRSFLALLLWWFSLRWMWSEWPDLFPRFEKIFFWTAIVSAIWIILSTAGYHFQIPFFSHVIPRKGFFPNENIAAGFLGMALLWGAHQRLNQKPVSWVGLSLLLLAWGMTESRGALVAMVLAVVAYLVLHMKEVEKRLSLWGTTQWFIFGAVILFVVAAISMMVNRLLNAETVDPRSYFRIDIWLSSLQMVKAQPLFGFGPGTYGDIYPYFRPVGLWNTSNPFAHNEFLQVACESGLPALLLVVLLLWGLYRQFWPATLRTPAFKAPTGSIQYAELAFYLMVIETAHNLVDFTFHEWSHRLVVMGFVAYALREKRVEDDLKTTFQFSRRSFWAGTAVVAVFVLWALGVGSLRDYLARLDDFKSILCEQAGDLDGAEALARRSLSFRSNDMDPWNSLGVIEDARAGLTRNPGEREKHFLAADDYFQRAIHFSPYAADPKENQVQSMVKRGRLEQALDLQKQLVDHGPQSPSVQADLARILLQMGRAKEAIAPAQKIIDLYPYFLPGYFLKANALEILGHKKEALKTFEDARDMLKSVGMDDPSGQVEPNIERLQGKP